MTAGSTRQQAIDAIGAQLRIALRVAGTMTTAGALTWTALAEAAYAAAEPLIRADQREQDAQLADDRRATWLEPCAEDDLERGLHTHHRRPFGDLLRAQS